jgi:hypothetical protein
LVLERLEDKVIQPGLKTMTEVQISKDISGKITVSFPYNPQLVQKVKTIPGRRWHPAEKYGGFPDTNGTLERIKKVFNGEETKVDPALEGKSFNLPVSNNKSREMKAEQTWFEDLRKELISRKYSCKTVKAYLFYNRDFLNFIRKHPDEVAWLRMLVAFGVLLGYG